MSKITIEDLFLKWKLIVKENYENQYLNRYRIDIIEILIELLMQYNISFEDARDLTQEVVLMLTTKEGRKGKGKYKGWKEKVEEDFKMMLADAYLEKEDKLVQENKNFQEIPLITAWTQKKFGNNWSNEINELAHTTGTILNIQFLKEVYGSAWVKDGKNIPDWCKKVL